jgi:hypothetical protein
VRIEALASVEGVIVVNDLSGSEEKFGTRFYSKHVVGLTARQVIPADVPGEAAWSNRIIITAFVMSMRGHWVLVTSGHVLNMMDDCRKAGHQFDQWILTVLPREGMIDKPFILFGFDSAHKLHSHVDEVGEDFALIYLGGLVEAQLIGKGIKPLVVDERLVIPDNSLARHILIGYPSQLFSLNREERVIQSEIVTIRVTHPVEDKGIFENWLFVGDLYDFRAEVDDFDTIKGMSGGPILLCWLDENGCEQHGVMAVQSGWDRSSLKICAYPVDTLIPKLDEFLRSIGL